MITKTRQFNFNKWAINSFFGAIIITTFSIFPINQAFAQTRDNIANVTNTAGQVLSGERNAGLTDLSIQRNTTGSCDSTCDAMGAVMPASSIQTAFNTQLTACGAGYTGSKTQTRNQNPDGSFTPWVDSDRSQCVCAPTYTDSTQTCASPLSGTYVQRTPWVCNNNVGSLGPTSQVSNSCFVPCALPTPPSQNQVVSCPSGYAGAGISQTRDSYCPGGVGANSSPAWNSWNTTANNCTPIVPPIVSCETKGYSAGNWIRYDMFNPGNAWNNINIPAATYGTGWVRQDRWTYGWMICAPYWVNGDTTWQVFYY